MEKNYQFGRSKSLLVGLCALTSVFVSSTITITAFGLNKEDACVNAEGAITENKISLTEIQLRSIDGTDAWYSYLVFLSDS